MDTKLRFLIEASPDGAIRATRVTGDELEKLEGKVARASRSASESIAASFRSMGSAATSAGAVITAGITVPLTAAAGAAIKLAGDFEQTRIAFTTMLGSAERATVFLKELEGFAARTPFEFKDLLEASKRMMALGFQAEQVLPTMTAIGDAVAALGGGGELINRITLALGQMQAKGKVSAEEMRQLAEAGIPAWEILAKEIGVSIPEAMDKAQKGAIQASQALPAILAGMSEKFGGLMEQQSQTFLGQISNLKDEMFFMMRDFGESLLPVAKDVLDNVIRPMVEKLKELTEWFNKLPPATQENIIKFAALAAAIGPLTVGFGILATSASSIITLFGAFGASTAGLVGFLTGPGGLVVAAGLAAAAIYATYREQLKHIESMGRDAEAVDKFTKELEEMGVVIDENRIGTGRWVDQMTQLKTSMEEIKAINFREVTAEMPIRVSLEALKDSLQKQFEAGQLSEKQYEAALKEAEEAERRWLAAHKSTMKEIDNSYGTIQETYVAATADLNAALERMLPTLEATGAAFGELPPFEPGEDLPEWIKELGVSFEQAAHPVDEMIKRFELLKMAGKDEVEILKVYGRELIAAADQQRKMGIQLSDTEEAWASAAESIQRNSNNLKDNFGGLFDYLDRKLLESARSFGGWGSIIIGIFRDLLHNADSFFKSIGDAIKSIGGGGVGGIFSGIGGAIGGMISPSILPLAISSMFSDNRYLRTAGYMGMGLAGLGGLSALGATGMLGGAGYGIGSFATSMLASPYTMLALPGIFGGMALADWASGPNAYEAGIAEIARDFGGLQVGQEAYQGYLQSIGVGESEAWPYRAQLNRTPLMIQQMAQMAQQQGRYDEFLRSLGPAPEGYQAPGGLLGVLFGNQYGYNNQGVYAGADWGRAVQFGMATGDWGQLDRAFVDLMQNPQFGSFAELMPDWREQVLLTDEYKDANTLLQESIIGLRNALKSTIPAAENVFQEFMADMEITEELRREVDRLGGSMESFTEVARLNELNRSLADMLATLLQTGEVMPGLVDIFAEFGGDMSVLNSAAQLPNLRSSLDFVASLSSRLSALSPRLSPVEQILGGAMGPDAIAALQGAGLDVGMFQQISSMITGRAALAGAESFSALTPELRAALIEYGGEAGMLAVERYDAGFNTITRDLLDTVLTSMDNEFAATIDEALADLSRAQETIGDRIAELTESITSEFSRVGDSLVDAINNAKRDLIDAMDVMIMNLLEGTVPSIEEYAATHTTAATGPLGINRVGVPYSPYSEPWSKEDVPVNGQAPVIQIFNPVIFDWASVQDEITRYGYNIDLRGGTTY